MTEFKQMLREVAKPISPAILPPREKLRLLAEWLREPMPSGFRWNFKWFYSEGNECGTVGCALGLAHHRGLCDIPYNTKLRGNDYWSTVLQVACHSFDISYTQAERLFMPVGYGSNRDAKSITTAEVAENIERLLAHEEQRERRRIWWRNLKRSIGLRA